MLFVGNLLNYPGIKAGETTITRGEGINGMAVTAIWLTAQPGGRGEGERVVRRQITTKLL